MWEATEVSLEAWDLNVTAALNDELHHEKGTIKAISKARRPQPAHSTASAGAPNTTPSA